MQMLRHRSWYDEIPPDFPSWNTIRGVIALEVGSSRRPCLHESCRAVRQWLHVAFSNANIDPVKDAIRLILIDLPPPARRAGSPDGPAA